VPDSTADKKTERAAKIRKKVLDKVDPERRIIFSQLPVAWLSPIAEQLRINRRPVLPEETYAIECNAEWHFQQFEGGTLCSAVYNTAYRFRKKKAFWVSIPNLALFLHATEATVRDAVHLLVAAGFFEVVESESGKSVRYRAVSHKEWQARFNQHADDPAHPDHVNYCAYMDRLPEYMQGDELGKALWAISCKHFRPFGPFLTSFRASGHDDAAIEKHWRTFLETNKPTGRQWYTIAKAFRDYLDAQPLPNDGY
jgi:hypothetical protein